MRAYHLLNVLNPIFLGGVYCVPVLLLRVFALLHQLVNLEAELGLFLVSNFLPVAQGVVAGYTIVELFHCADVFPPLLVHLRLLLREHLLVPSGYLLYFLQMLLLLRQIRV